MNIFSFPFFILWILCLAGYYTVAGNCQWMILLIMSFVFYAGSVTKVPAVLILVLVSTYVGGRWIAYGRTENGRIPEKVIRWVKWMVVCLCIITLIPWPATGWFAMLGNSYFTLKAVSYICDVDRDEKNCEKNPLFYLLYLIYLPTILQGPFNRFAQFKKSFAGRIHFDYIEVMHGIQRFLWGTFKKLVLTVRLEQIVNYVYDNPAGQSGLSIIIGTVACSLWLYIDFSGYMDMMLGMSGTFGVVLPENFRQPYFSRSISEFWRRWHITLGGIFRDYLMMPFIQSKPGRWFRKHFKRYGKSAGKLAPVLAGTFLVWISTALWHGFSRKYLIWGMYYCVIISSSLVLEKTYERIKQKLHVSEASKLYGIFCMTRTWIILLIANVILQVNSFHDFYIVVRQIIGRSFLTGDCVSLTVLNWYRQDAVILGTGLLILLIVSVGKEKGFNILDLVDHQILPVQWGIYYFLLFSVLFFGIYGPQYDVSQFLYMQF